MVPALLILASAFVVSVTLVVTGSALAPVSAGTTAMGNMTESFNEMMPFIMQIMVFMIFISMIMAVAANMSGGFNRGKT